MSDKNSRYLNKREVFEVTHGGHSTGVMRWDAVGTDLVRCFISFVEDTGAANDETLMPNFGIWLEENLYAVRVEKATTHLPLWFIFAKKGPPTRTGKELNDNL